MFRITKVGEKCNYQFDGLFIVPYFSMRSSKYCAYQFDFLTSDAAKSNDHSRRCVLLRFLHGYMVSLLHDMMYFSYLFGYSYSNFKIKTKV